ncbi:hypothetical protein D3C79_666670 [compost metagenome]
MVAVVDEVVAVGIVGIGRDYRLVSHDPAAIRAIHEQPVQLRHDAFLLHQQGMQARPVDVLEAVAFQALGQRRGNCVDLADGVFGMLRRGPGQVGDHVLGIGEGVPVVAPDTPAFHHDEGQHHHQHERQYQAEQRHGAALASYREEPVFILFPGCTH